MPRLVYFDFNASTPLAPEVVAVMQSLLTEHFGNPSSRHWAGAAAHAAIATARGHVAALLGASPGEIVFTGGGSEANNLAIKGLVEIDRAGGHVVTCAVEHPAVLQPCEWLRRRGAQVTIVPVDRFGQVDPGDVERALTPATRLVTIMHANNEVGTIQPIRAIARVAHERGVLVHTDAAQSVGKIPTRVGDLGVDLLTVAGHKLYAPKGVGALYVRDGLRLEPLIHGAGHETGRRAGTENTLAIAGLGEACRIAHAWIDAPSILCLRDRFWNGLRAKLGDRVVLNGHPAERLPNTLNVSFVGERGPELLARLDGVAASTGSACHSGSVTISPVLAAMSVAQPVAAGAIRFSLGRSTTAEEIDHVLDMIA